MENYNIKKYISQRCLGYSFDFLETYFLEKVQLKNGRVKTIYTTYRENKYGFQSLPTHSETCPFICNPI